MGYFHIRKKIRIERCTLLFKQFSNTYIAHVNISEFGLPCDAYSQTNKYRKTSLAFTVAFRNSCGLSKIMEPLLKNYTNLTSIDILFTTNVAHEYVINILHGS